MSEFKGKLIVFSAPSGSGKTTIVRHLLKQKELDLEYPYYLYFQDEVCNDELIKVFPEYEIVVKYEVGGMKIEKTWHPFYEEHQILNNLTTEEHFNKVFSESLEQITYFKDGKQT